jgi:hypothetical protein
MCDADKRSAGLSSMEVIEVVSDNEQIHTPVIKRTTVRLSYSVNIQVILLPRTISAITGQLSIKTSVGILKLTVRPTTLSILICIISTHRPCGTGER